jgi:hypothetical protein
MRQVLPVVPAKQNPHYLIFKSCKSFGWLKRNFTYFCGLFRVYCSTMQGCPFHLLKQARPWMFANLKIICQFHAHASLALQVAPVSYYKYGTTTQMRKSHLTRYAYTEIMGNLLICISKMAISSSQKFSQRFLKEIFCSGVQVFFWGEIFDITPIKSSTSNVSKIYKLFAVLTLF